MSMLLNVAGIIISIITSAGLSSLQVGLELLQNDGGVFACHPDIDKTIKFSELGASSVIMNAGLFSCSLAHVGAELNCHCWTDEMSRTWHLASMCLIGIVTVSLV